MASRGGERTVNDNDIRLDRRAMLLRSGAVLLTLGVGPTLLAACGGSGGSDTGGAGAEGVPTASADGEIGGAVDFISWEGYDTPDAIKPWVDANGVQINASYIATHDDIQAKILTADGSTGFDITTYDQGYAPLYQELGIMQALDSEKIPNIKNLFEYFQGDVGNFWVNADGTRFGVPWTFSYVALTWDDQKLPGGVQSYYDLLDPSLTGRVAVIDEPLGNLGLASHILGMKPDEISRETDLPKLEEFFGQILAQTPGVSASIGDATNLLVSGEADICWQGWAAMNSFAAAAGNPNIKTGLPKEGGSSFCSAFAIPITADNPQTAYSWINNILEPDVNAAASDYLVSATPVVDSVALLDPTTRDLYPYYEDLDEFLTISPFSNYPPIESEEFMTQKEWLETWTELKANAGT